MQSAVKSQVTRRVTWLTCGAIAWSLAILLRLIQLQVLRHDEFSKLARDQQLRMIEIPGPRGSIYDCNGQVLAMSVPIQSVFVTPKRLRNLAVAADVIAPVLHLERDELYARLRSAQEDRKRDGFCWVKRNITKAEEDNLRSLKLPWIEFQVESLRQYPRDQRAAHVLGSVDFRGRGNAGLELGLDDELRGEAGAVRMLTDVHKNGIDSELFEEPKLGKNITITIDERIQFIAERELKEAVESKHCTTGSVVAIDPHTGNILAMASYPTYDPNTPPDKSDKGPSHLNMAIAAPFEPGSVFKVITISTALETTNLRPDTIIPCGRLTIFNRNIREDSHFYGPMPMSDVLAHSSNVGAVQIGLKIGKEKLYEYIRRFGFGQKTGLPLPAESAGLLRRPERWNKDTIASVPFGHEISATTLQLAQGCSVIASGGLLIRPRLVLKRQTPGAPVEAEPMQPPVRVIKPETAIEMRQMMEGVVLRGTGKTTKLEGYTSGGKTGTAQIYDYATRHYTHFYNASFMGFAPVTNPAIVVSVTINGARGHGATVAGPVFKAVTQEALRVLDVPKDLPDGPGGADSEILKEEDKRIAVLDSDEQAEAPAPRVFGPEPPPAAEFPRNGEVYGPRVPNFRGKTMRAVVQEAASMGLPVSLDGKGVARQQDPPPGTILPRGERIRVLFRR